MAQSADNTVIYYGSGTITDAYGNVWSIDSAGQVTIDGVADPTTSHVSELAYVNGLVWQANNQGLWWSKASPTAAWAPPAGITTNPTLPIQASANGSVIGASSGGPAVSITDTSGNTWRIANGQVVVNGTVDPNTANVIELAYENGQIWQENSQGLWWSKRTPGDSWGPPAGTSVNPVTGTFYIGNTAGNDAIVNIGELTASNGAAAAPQSTSGIVTTGVQAAGTKILISTEVALLVIDGNSSLTQGATLETLGAYRAPRPIYGPVQNNGVMTVNSSTVDIGVLSGNGAIVAANGSTLNIQGSDAGNTIQLDASNLYIGGQGGGPGTFGPPGGLSFLAPITMDQASTITLNATQATSEVVNTAGGSVSEVLLYDGTAKVADLHVNSQTMIYAADNPKTDTVTLTTTNGGGSLPVSAVQPANPGIAVTDTTTGQPVGPFVQPYTGPVPGLQNQYIASTNDGLNITTTTPNWFIASGSGNDAIDVSQGGGNNVVDGGRGSNFLTGGSGNDTFFIDDRAATSAIWSTIAGFHAGDAVTVWGVMAQNFALTWIDGQGAVGNTGLTLSVAAANTPAADFTLVGYDSADLNSGKLSISFGTTPDQPGLPGSPYMQVRAN
ncbi:MAG TPA: hypothetical protein DDZ81_20430 [Acetobacteraceae bacterium]|nr:hypothetical protein [Acetobacteraceae bacterium]